MKSEEEVVSDFNEIVNMTAEELDEYLHTEASETTGYKKDDGSGEAIGHESGRKIVEILKRNPSKDPEKYTDEDKEHMRRVVSYCKRHLAQESHLKDEKTPEELEKMKSTRSLKNWGHDPLKSSGSTQGGSNKPKSSGKPASKKATKKEEPAKGDKEPAEKPKSSGKPKSAAKPSSKKTEAKEAGPAVEEKAEGEKPKSKGRAKPVSKKAEEADKGEKRGAVEVDKAEEVEQAKKPASKKAKTEKPVTEGTRKPPSRGAKKA